MQRQLHIYIRVGSRDLFIDEAHGAGHIPGIFSLHAAYSALRHFSILMVLQSPLDLKFGLALEPKVLKLDI